MTVAAKNWRETHKLEERENIVYSEGGGREKWCRCGSIGVLWWREREGCGQLHMTIIVEKEDERRGKLKKEK